MSNNKKIISFQKIIAIILLIISLIILIMGIGRSHYKIKQIEIINKKQNIEIEEIENSYLLLEKKYELAKRKNNN